VSYSKPGTKQTCIKEAAMPNFEEENQNLGHNDVNVAKSIFIT
jgi:hypothetical protein